MSESSKDKADSAFRSKDFQQAISLYSECITSDPSNSTLYSNRCAAYIQLQKYENALVDAEKAVELKPDWNKAYFRLSQCLQSLGRIEPAFSALHRAHSLAPSPTEYMPMVQKIISKSVETNFELFQEETSCQMILYLLKSNDISSVPPLAIREHCLKSLVLYLDANPSSPLHNDELFFEAIKTTGEMSTRSEPLADSILLHKYILDCYLLFIAGRLNSILNSKMPPLYFHDCWETTLNLILTPLDYETSRHSTLIFEEFIVRDGISLAVQTLKRFVKANAGAIEFMTLESVIAATELATYHFLSVEERNSGMEEIKWVNSAEYESKNKALIEQKLSHLSGIVRPFMHIVTEVAEYDTLGWKKNIFGGLAKSLSHWTMDSRTGVADAFFSDALYINGYLSVLSRYQSQIVEEDFETGWLDMLRSVSAFKLHNRPVVIVLVDTLITNLKRDYIGSKKMENMALIAIQALCLLSDGNVPFQRTILDSELPSAIVDFSLTNSVKQQQSKAPSAVMRFMLKSRKALKMIEQLGTQDIDIQRDLFKSEAVKKMIQDIIRGAQPAHGDVVSCFLRMLRAFPASTAELCSKFSSDSLDGMNAASRAAIGLCFVIDSMFKQNIAAPHLYSMEATNGQLILCNQNLINTLELILTLIRNAPEVAVPAFFQRNGSKVLDCLFANPTVIKALNYVAPTPTLDFETCDRMKLPAHVCSLQSELLTLISLNALPDVFTREVRTELSQLSVGTLDMVAALKIKFVLSVHLEAEILRYFSLLLGLQELENGQGSCRVLLGSLPSAAASSSVSRWLLDFNTMPALSAAAEPIPAAEKLQTHLQTILDIILIRLSMKHLTKESIMHGCSAVISLLSPQDPSQVVELSNSAMPLAYPIRLRPNEKLIVDELLPCLYSLLQRFASSQEIVEKVCLILAVLMKHTAFGELNMALKMKAMGFEGMLQTAATSLQARSESLGLIVSMLLQALK